MPNNNHKEREEYILYDGKVKLYFDPAKHLYTVDDEENGQKDERVLGVTSINGVIGKPALMYWAVGEACAFVESNLAVGVALDEVQKAELIAGMKRAHTIRKTKAADIGTMIHEWVEKYAKAKIHGDKLPDLPVNEQMRNAVQAFLRWEEKMNVKFHLSERKIYSRKHKFAGTLDLEGEVAGKLGIIDIKTSSGIYPEMAFQTSAYLKARAEETGKDYLERWIVRIGKDGVLEVKQFLDHERDFEAFLGAHSIYRRQMELKDEILNQVEW